MLGVFGRITVCYVPRPLCQAMRGRASGPEPPGRTSEWHKQTIALLFLACPSALAVVFMDPVGGPHYIGGVCRGLMAETLRASRQVLSKRGQRRVMSKHNGDLSILPTTWMLPAGKTPSPTLISVHVGVWERWGAVWPDDRSFMLPFRSAKPSAIL